MIVFSVCSEDSRLRQCKHSNRLAISINAKMFLAPQRPVPVIDDDLLAMGVCRLTGIQDIDTFAFSNTVGRSGQ
jgi:hypothetical protein